MLSLIRFSYSSELRMDPAPVTRIEVKRRRNEVRE